MLTYKINVIETLKESGYNSTRILKENIISQSAMQKLRNNEMVGIKELCSILGLTESAVKQACQQERLLNTKKIGKNWMVHIPECRAYWNIPDEDEKHLYKDYIY